MPTNLHEPFLQLVRLGISLSEPATNKEEFELTRTLLRCEGGKRGRATEFLDNVDWMALKALADTQGLSAIVLDGIEKCYTSLTDITEILPLEMKLEWIGEVLRTEAQNDVQNKTAESLAELFQRNNIRTYVLKGAVIAECYPNPSHRLSVDMDCFLLPVDGGFDAWKLGNDLVKSKGFEVDEGFYKNSSFHLPGLMVENHQFMIPFRGNKKLRNLERVIQSVMSSDKGEDRFEDTWLYRPPVMASALFLIEHAYSHFLHEGLTWRMVLDWMLFSHKHKAEINWPTLDTFIDDFGFRKFYDSYCHLGQFLIGELCGYDCLSAKDRLMLEDIWAPLDLHESLQDLKTKFQLVGNYWRARWKYKYFTEMSWVRALMEWVFGAVFDRHPKLN